MKVRLENGCCTLLEFTTKWKELKKVCSFELPGAKYTDAFKERGWDGTLSLLRNSGFPTGLLEKVKKIDNVEAIDCRRRPSLEKSLEWYGPKLRNYQEIIKKVVEKERGILSYPCGSGKTIMFASLLAYLNLSALVVVPSLTLLTQTSRVLKNCLHQEIGEIGQGEEKIEKFTVTTIQSLNKMESLGELKNVDVLIVDEIHHTVGLGKWFWNLLEVDAFFRYGFSATPWRSVKSQNILLEAVTGQIIAEIPAQDLIEAGYLVPVELDIVELNGKSYWGEWQKVYQKGIVENEDRNEKIIEKIEEYKGASTLVLVERIEHGEILSMMSGVPFVSGKDTQGRRDQLLTEFKTGRRIKLIASRIFSEGVDIPCLEVLIIASGGRSDVKVIQSLGRVLRPFPGKSKAVLVDFMDGGLLGRHSLERFETYRQYFGTKNYLGESLSEVLNGV